MKTWPQFLSKKFKITYRLLLWSMILIAGHSCREKTDLFETKTLRNSLELLTSINESYLKKINEHIEINSQRPADVNPYKELNQFLANSSFGLPKSVPEYDNRMVKEVENYVDHLVTGSKNFSWHDQSNLTEAIHLIRESRENFHKKRDEKSYLLLLINLLTLQNHLIAEVVQRFGVATHDAGFAYIYLPSDTVEQNRKIRAVIALEKPVNEDLFEVDLELVNFSAGDKAITEFELDNMGGGSWILTFLPERSGTYTLEFQAVASRRNHPGFGYSYILKKQFSVR